MDKRQAEDMGVRGKSQRVLLCPVTTRAADTLQVPDTAYSSSRGSKAVNYMHSESKGTS